ncbi:hypothetical protein [Nocardia farcinica]|uniref:hypothetical protein n=1 Tax=Nocardia farcinica TaxID=37329 RepID=UPI0037A3338D
MRPESRAPDPGEDRPHLELARADDDWIRAEYLPEALYHLRYRRAGGDRYELYTADHRWVRDILVAWAARDDRWRESPAWSRIDPAIAELETVRGEMSELLDGFGLLDALGEFDDGLDDALRRADELLGDDGAPVDPPPG